MDVFPHSLSFLLYCKYQIQSNHIDTQTALVGIVLQSKFTSMRLISRLADRKRLSSHLAHINITAFRGHLSRASKTKRLLIRAKKKFEYDILMYKYTNIYVLNKMENVYIKG